MNQIKEEKNEIEFITLYDLMVYLQHRLVEYFTYKYQYTFQDKDNISKMKKDCTTVQVGIQKAINYGKEKANINGVNIEFYAYTIVPDVEMSIVARKEENNELLDKDQMKEIKLDPNMLDIFYDYVFKDL